MNEVLAAIDGLASNAGVSAVTYAKKMPRNIRGVNIENERREWLLHLSFKLKVHFGPAARRRGRNAGGESVIVFGREE